MTHSKAALIARLRAADLPSDNYGEVATSLQSLKVRIHNLREQGFQIASIDRAGSGQGRPKVSYRLIDAPAVCCTHCGAAL